MADLPRRIGKFEVLTEKGRGAMGTVYKAYDPNLGRLVALKTMSEALLVDEEMRERFYREARSAARLQHPNIVTIYDLGEADGAPFIAMEFLEGRDLAQAMHDQSLSRLEDKIRLVVQVCRGLDFAHKRGVIHRDIKPGNIMVLPDGTAKILDFGIARREDTTMKTKTGLVMGTPNYMAPEQITGATVDHRADMWAVGVILHEILAGRRPFEAETVPSLIYRIVHRPLPQMDASVLGIPEALVDVVGRALRKEPDGRFRDMADMAAALERAIGVPVSEDTISEEARERAFHRNFELGRSLLAGGQPARALEAARKARALEPSKAEVVRLIEEIEDSLRKYAEQATIAMSEEPSATRQTGKEMDRWIDQARLALTAGNRTEALRIVEDVLSVEPTFPSAIELRDLLDKPAAPGRVRTGQQRTYTQAEIRVRRRASSFQEHITFGERLGIQVIAVSPREQVVAAGGTDGSIRLWDLPTRSKVATLRGRIHQRAGHEGLVTSLAFSPDGRFLASGHVDGAIHIWSMDAGEEMKVRVGHEGSVGGIEFSPDGSLLASGGLDSTLKLWEMDRLQLGEPRRRLVRQPAAVAALAFARDGTSIVTGHSNRILRHQDVPTGRLIVTLRGHQAGVSFLAVAPNGALVASGGHDRSIRLFDLQLRAEVGVLQGHKKAVSSIAFFPSGQQLASVAMENNLIVWDVKATTPVVTLWGGAEDCFASVQVFEGGQQVACALADGRIRIWLASPDSK